jgi:cytochrome oxidase Cu insertion factor (SCO1/SenC/PrrC family)
MNEPSPAGTKRGRLEFLLIVALFTVPLLGAVGWYALAPGTVPAPATHGSLIDPARPLEAFSVPASGDGDTFTLENLRGRWTLVQVVDHACEADCAERLYYTRQIRTALGRDRQRVQRVTQVARRYGFTPEFQQF